MNNAKNVNVNATVDTIIVECNTPDGGTVLRTVLPADIDDKYIVKQAFIACGGVEIPEGTILKKGGELYRFQEGEFKNIKIDISELGKKEFQQVMEDLKDPDKLAETLRKVAEEVKKSKATQTEVQQEQAEIDGTEEDKKANVLKGLLSKVLTAMDTFLGVSATKERIKNVLSDELGKNKFLSIANRIDTLIREEVEILTLFDDEESVKNAIFLKTLIGEDGKEVKKKSVFEVIFSAFAWLVEKIDKKLRKIGVQPDGTANMLGKSIAAFLGAIKEGGHLIFEVTVTGLSVTIAGVLRLVDIVLGVVRKIFLAAKDMIARKNATEKVAEQ